MEKDDQAAIVEILKLFGFGVKSTSTHRQRGPSGCDKGIADLIVFDREMPFLSICIEVKRSDKPLKLTPEQVTANNLKEFFVATSADEAVLGLAIISKHYKIKSVAFGRCQNYATEKRLDRGIFKGGYEKLDF